MKKFLKILQSCPLFDSIDEPSLLHMLDCLDARCIRFDKKYTIMAEGSTARYIGIVLSGAAQVVRVDYYGNRSLLTRLEPGDVFAEAFACAQVETLPVSILAESACEIMLIDSRHVLHTCEKHCVFHQQLIFNLMKDLAVKTLKFHSRAQIVSGRTTRDKLLGYLMMQAKEAGSNAFDIPLDRQGLADYLEVDRSGLSAEISKLRREGVLQSSKNHFVLL